MSFIDTYLKDHQINKIVDSTKKNLAKLEKTLDKITLVSKNGLSFLDAMKENGSKIADLVERVQKYFDGWEFGWSTTFSAFQFVQSIATEVFQIVDTMNDNIVPTGATEAEAAVAKRTFGIELTYFVWKTIDPLKKTLRWIPFKKMIEKKLVKWLAGMGLNAASRLFNANKEIGAFAVNNNGVFVKAL